MRRSFLALLALPLFGLACSSSSTKPKPTDAAAVDDATSADDAATADDAIAVANDAFTSTDVDFGPHCPVPVATEPAGLTPWNTVTGLKMNAAWYQSDIGVYIAENILYYQIPNVGGWGKNFDMTVRSTPVNSAEATKAMIDNSATTTQIIFMAHMVQAWPGCQRYLDSFNKGMTYLFMAQYQTNGGWPQVFPIEPSDYSRHITYNDNAMKHVMEIMRDLSTNQPLYSFVDDTTRAQAGTAMQKGVECMLNTQITLNGVKSAWCAQHDEITLLPANARAYELASESGREGAGVLAFLMTLNLDNQTNKQAIIDAVEAAVTWFNMARIDGYRYVRANLDGGAIADSWLVPSPTSTIWARFYEIEPAYRTLFVGRDGLKHFTWDEFAANPAYQERRGGYDWFVTDPSGLLTKTYPAWAKINTPGRNVLGSSDGGAGVDDAPILDADSIDAN